MSCATGDEWTLLSAGLLDDARVGVIRAHLQTCEQCRTRFEQTRRDHAELMRVYEAYDREHDALREQLMAALPDEPATERGRLRLGELVMSLNKTTGRRALAVLAPAACILIAVVIFLDPSEKSAFAAAIEHLRRTNTIVCRVTTTMKVHMQADARAGASRIDPARFDELNETQTVRNEKLYLSAGRGVRRDAQEGGALVSTTYTSNSGATLVLYPEERSYQKFDVDDEIKQASAGAPGPDIHFMSLAQSPDRLLRGLRNLTAKADRELGRKTFDGRELIGFEIGGEKVGFGPPLTDHAEENRAELWVDAKSGVAARLVFHFVSSVSGTRELPLKASFAMTTVYDRFEWDPSLAADWFEAVIPDGYARRVAGLPEQVQMPDEAALLEALRVFNEVAGRYPSSLNAMNAGQEVAFVLGSIGAKRIMAERSGEAAADVPDLDSVGAKLQGLALYAFLEMQGREPEYFGDSVTVADADKVLLRWRLDDGRIRVIYGNLRVETVPGGK